MLLMEIKDYIEEYQKELIAEAKETDEDYGHTMYLEGGIDACSYILSYLKENPWTSIIN